jgi:D-alanyl-D-alanine carboxypeptidase
VLVLRNGRVKSYRGEDDELVPDHVFEWPEYAIVHAELYTTVDDLGAFLNAVCEGRLAKPETLLRLWKPHTRESLMDVMSRHDDAR